MNVRWFSPMAVLVGVVAVAAAEPPARLIERARPGQWILEQQTRVASSRIDTTYQATWVDKIDGRKILLRRQAVSADRKTGVTKAVEVVVDLDRKPAEAPRDENRATLETDETLVIAGKTLKCKKVEVVSSDPVLGKHVLLTWTSPDVPLFGLVKLVELDRDGREIARKELLAWGESGGSELPVPGNN